MAIIRNDRLSRKDSENDDEPLEEEEIDYRWHPTEDEYVSPLSVDQWAELLSDPSFADTDAARAVRCLHDYGEPATFQQLSIRYRGTMGRYRRWLGEAAQAAGERFGMSAPQKNQFGMDEWWPVLYHTRATGKPGAGVFEMRLRPEVEGAFELLEEQERQAKRAENARQLQRIEQLERARKEERERMAAQAEVAKVEAAPVDVVREPPIATSQTSQEPAPAPVVVVPVPPVPETVSEPVQQDQPQHEFRAMRAFLGLMQERRSPTGHRFANRPKDVLGLQDIAFDVSSPIDYALRYAERLRRVFALMHEGLPSLTVAMVARAVGDESVEHLQTVLNGQCIPSFEYLNALRDCLFVNIDWLEAADGRETTVPSFCALDEAWGIDGIVSAFAQDKPCEIVYVVDDSATRRTGVIVRFSAVSCALLTRTAVDAEATRSQSVDLDAFVRMVDELDEYARTHGVARASSQISADDWDGLVDGTVWPGVLV